VLVVLALALSTFSARSLAQEGRATGTLRLNSATVDLQYAYASFRRSPLDKTSENIHVLLSDLPLPDSARDDLFTLVGLGRKGEAHIIEVVIDASGMPVNGVIYAAAFNGMASLEDIHEFERERLDRTSIAGRLRTRVPGTFASIAFEYNARFSALIRRSPTDKERASVLASPPAVAAATYLRALAAGDINAFRQSLVAGRAEVYTGAKGIQRFLALRAEMPSDMRVANVLKLTDTDASVGVEGYRSGSVIELVLPLKLERGAWKVDR
jgi:hypothetical protein